MRESKKVTREIKDVIEQLRLAPHPEGGFFRETFRAKESVMTPRGPRSSSTAIYFLLPAQEFSAWHRVSADEVWHHYSGVRVEIHTIDTATRSYEKHVLDSSSPQLVVPADVWQAAFATGEKAHALCGCTVAPGFDFADFEMPTRAELLRAFPEHRVAIEAFTRDPD